MRLAAALACALFAAPAFAQGHGQSKSKPPSGTTLPKATVAGAPGAGVGAVPWGGISTAGAPAAWIDEANLLEPGGGVISLYVSRWQGASSSELDAPVVDASVGLARRLQLGVTMPHVVGNADGNAVGGLGTTFVSAKVGLTESTAIVKLAMAPTLEILGQGALASLSTGASRVRWALPAIVEVDRGSGRVFASTGYFSPGSWFAGVGVGAQATNRAGVTVSVNRAWSSGDGLAVPKRVRNELAGGLSYAVTPALAAFASVAHTIATADELGAGLTIAGGISVRALRGSR